MDDETYPALRQVVLDTTDARSLAEFYRQLLGFDYQPGDEPPEAGRDDPRGRDWLVLEGSGGLSVAFQQVESLPASTWPGDEVPQQLHLDLTVPDREELDAQHARAVTLGATLVLDSSDDPTEQLRVYTDPAGHPFCIFVSPD
jgi:catechol 2,3-dioxygenase-like lactoylglutathione lyase family enzyme